MQEKTKNIISVVSVIINIIFIILFILLFVFSLGAKKDASVSFYNPDPEKYFTSVSLFSVSDNSSIIFNPVEVNLGLGDCMYYQLSSIVERKQFDYLITPLYDHNILNITPAGFGIQITAINTGDTVIQILASDGIKDLIFITVK